MTNPKKIIDIADAPTDDEIYLRLSTFCNPSDFDIESEKCNGYMPSQVEIIQDAPNDAEMSLHLTEYCEPEAFGIKAKADVTPGIRDDDKPNDARTAMMIAEHLAKRHIFCNDDSGLYVYNVKTGVYEALSKDGDFHGSIAYFVTNNAPEFQDDLKSSIFNMVFRQLRNSRKLSRKMPPCNDDMVAFRNGVYNIVTGEFSLHNPCFGLKSCVAAYYSSQPELSHVSQRYFEQLGGGPVGGRLILAALGIILSNYRKLGKSIIFYGPRSNGKSTLANFVRKVLPPKSVRGLSMSDFGNQFAIANLKNAHATICTDLPTGKWSNAAIGKFKQTVTGDFFEAGPKGVQHDTIEPRAFVVLIANFLPKIPRSQDPEGAVQRRIWAIKTGESVASDQVDPNLLEKLQEDVDSITSVAMHEATNLLKRRDIKKIIDASDDDIYEIQPIVAEDCMDEFIGWLDFTDNAEDRITLKKLYEIFVPRYCEQCPEIRTMRINGFAVCLRKAIKDVGGTVRKLNNVSTLVGYRLPEL